MKKYIKPAVEIFEAEVANAILGVSETNPEVGKDQLSKGWNDFDYEDEDW